MIRCLTVARLDELGDLFDVRFVNHGWAGQEVVALDQAVLEVVGEEQNRHVTAPKLLLIYGEGLAAVTDRVEGLCDDVVPGEHEVGSATVSLGGQKTVDHVTDTRGSGGVGMSPQIIYDRLGLLAGIHGQLEEIAGYARGFQRFYLGIGAVAAGCIAWLLVADQNTTLHTHRDEPLRRELASGPLVGTGTEKENIVRVADLRAGRRRRSASEGDPRF